MVQCFVMQDFDTTRNATGDTILVADDVDISRQLIKTHLGKLYRIIEAKNGLEVVNLLKSPTCKISCILLDILMPVMDGIKVLAFMRENGLLKHIPVIAMTAISDTNGKISCYEAGASDIIEKPYDPRILHNRVKHYIELYASIQQALEQPRDGAGDSSARFSAILDSLPQAVFVFNNATLKISYCNAAFPLIPGMAQNPVGKPLAEIFRPSDYAAILAAVSSLLTARIQRPTVIQVGGLSLSLLFNAILDASGNVTDIVGTAANVTGAAGAQNPAPQGAAL